MKSKKHTVLFLITAFTLVTISTLIGCEKQFLITKIDDTKESEKGSTPINGIGERSPGFLYTFGTIIIQYDEETWRQTNKKHTPIKIVNDFLVSKGYTPKVRGILPERFIEVIDIDKNMDTLPLLRELRTVPGVVAAKANDLVEYAGWLGWNGMPSVKDGPRLITANRVGKMEDGRLFELGVLLVSYEETVPLEMGSAPVVAVLQSLSDKGYKPIVKDVLHSARAQVIDIDENINPLPLFTELRTITGVSHVELNTLYEIADILLGTIALNYRSFAW